MGKLSAKPGGCNGSALLMTVFGGVVVGLVVFIARKVFGPQDSPRHVFRYILAGALAGGLAALLRQRRARR